MEWLALIVGGAILLVLMLVRQLASIAIPLGKWQCLKGAQPPLAYAEEFQKTDSILRTLGFQPVTWVALLPASTETKADIIGQQLTYVHSTGHAEASVQLPEDIRYPQWPVVTICSVFEDGSTLTSSSQSPYEEVLSTTIHARHNLMDVDPSRLWQEHQQRCEARASQRVDLSSLAAPEAMCAYINKQFHGMFDTLIEQGWMYVDSQQQARFRPRHYLNVLRRIRAAEPKPLPGPTRLDLAKQQAMLPVVERASMHAPGPQMQFVLLLVSSALFALIGSLWWSWSAALALCVTLIIHESGHYLAMRQAGYRNVQMVLLPLLGGVTTGVERDPHADKRAFISLMGPLPGIALGWLLLGLWQTGAMEGVTLWWGEFVFHLAISLLLLNYLNLLPVPPLDGGHVVQALLPRRWPMLYYSIVLALLLLGLTIAWVLNWWLLFGLVALQLFGLHSAWQDARLLRQLGPSLSTLPPAAQDRRLLVAVDAQKPNMPLPQRLSRVLNLRSQLNLQPSAKHSHVLLITLYLGAFAFPVAFLSPLQHLGAGWFAQWGTPLAHDISFNIEEAHQQVARMQEAVRVQTLKSQAMPVSALLADLHAQATQPPAVLPPPTLREFDAAEQRLGRSLPTEYRELASTAERSIIGALAPDQIGPLRADLSEELSEQAKSAILPIIHAPTGDVRNLPLAQATQAWLMAAPEADQLLLYNAAYDADTCCRILYYAYGTLYAYPDVHAWLVEHHVEMVLAGHQ